MPWTRSPRRAARHPAAALALAAVAGCAGPEPGSPASGPEVTQAAPSVPSDAEPATKAELRAYAIARLQIARLVRDARDRHPQAWVAVDAADARQTRRILHATPNIDAGRYLELTDAARVNSGLRARMRAEIARLRRRHDL